jgi:hypothetical protein
MSNWLRRKSDGVIYGYHEALARQKDIFDEVTEEEAWPERFAPPIDPVKQKDREAKSGLAKALEQPIPPTEVIDDMPLRREASRKLPK